MMARYSVTVPPRIVAGLRRHAAAVLPAECCGALIGVTGRGRADVRTMIPLDNAAAASDRYHIDAAAVLRLERQAERAGLQVLGFYHSHPAAPATPSTTDLELAVPGYCYVIISAVDGCVRGWRLRSDRDGFMELELRTLLAGAA
jgi:proteasome lid subunit RPN8/RPN11